MLSEPLFSAAVTRPPSAVTGALAIVAIVGSVMYDPPMAAAVVPIVDDEKDRPLVPTVLIHTGMVVCVGLLYVYDVVQMLPKVTLVLAVDDTLTQYAVLLEAEPSVLALFAEDPFDGRPPRYVRARVSDYRFGDWALLLETGRWWRVEPLGPYTPTYGR